MHLVFRIYNEIFLINQVISLQITKEVSDLVEIKDRNDGEMQLNRNKQNIIK